MMTSEEKQLVLKDLSTRLPYGVIINVHDTFPYTRLPYFNISLDSALSFIEPIFKTKDRLIKKVLKEHADYLEFRPYLRLLSSMTKEEKEELELLCDSMEIDDEGNVFDFIIILLNHIPKNINLEVIDWLNSHHFDYRGLIGKGLALEAPEDMYDFLWKD